MYDVTPEVRDHWHTLLKVSAAAAGAYVDCIDHAAPLPLTDLWARGDLAAAFMCGYPLVTRYPRARPLVAPVTVLAEDDKPSYRSVWLVNADSAFDTLQSTFGHRVGWLADHSHSGFNAPRHALLSYRTALRPTLYSESVGPLAHPRGALRALAAGRIDVTALDAYWWWLLQRYDAAASEPFRPIGWTPAAPMPPLVCAEAFPAASASRLVAALSALPLDPSAAARLAALGIRRFAAVKRVDFVPLASLEHAADAAGYRQPA